MADAAIDEQHPKDGAQQDATLPAAELPQKQSRQQHILVEHDKQNTQTKQNTINLQLEQNSHPPSYLLSIDEAPHAAYLARDNLFVIDNESLGFHIRADQNYFSSLSFKSEVLQYSFKTYHFKSVIESNIAWVFDSKPLLTLFTHDDRGASRFHDDFFNHDIQLVENNAKSSFLGFLENNATLKLSLLSNLIERFDDIGLNSYGNLGLAARVNFDLSDLSSLNNINDILGFSLFEVISNFNSGDGFQLTVAGVVPVFHGVGDINNDGYFDFVIGNNAANDAYVIYGGISAFTSFNINQLDGSNGFTILASTAETVIPGGGGRGPGGDFDYSDLALGSSVWGNTDFNNDGITDFGLGAPGFDYGTNVDSGAVYAFLGQNGNFNANFSLTDLDGSNGLTIYSSTAGEGVGIELLPVWDVDGDDVADYYFAEAGQDAYLLKGSEGIIPASIDLATTADGNVTDVRHRTSTAQQNISDNIDITGSGLYDLIGRVETPGTNFHAVFKGRYDDATSNFVFTVEQFISTNNPLLTNYEKSMSNVGDVNRDGFEDLALYNFTTNSTQIIFGKEGHLGTQLDPPNNHIYVTNLDSLALDGTNGFTIQHKNNGGLEVIVDKAGDINGDGFDDILINNPLTGQAVQVIYGRADFNETLDSNSLTASDGTNISFANFSGGLLSATALNDINGDGLGDLVFNHNNSDFAIVYGQANETSITGSANADNLVGTSGNDIIFGLQGNDILNGIAGSDRLIGGQGDDIFIVDNQFDFIDGGTGFDILRINNGDLDLTNLSNSKIKDIEQIELLSDQASKITLEAADILTMINDNALDRLLIRGGNQHQVEIVNSADWTHQGISNINGVNYNHYEHNNVAVYVEQFVTVIT